MGLLQPGHVIVILAIALIVFGPGRLSEIGGQLGRGIREFRESADGREPAQLGAAARYCTECGAAAAADASFCSRCGHALHATPS